MQIISQWGIFDEFRNILLYLYGPQNNITNDFYEWRDATKTKILCILHSVTFILFIKHNGTLVS